MSDCAVILVVEDREDDILLLRNALRKANLANPVHFVRDGEEAVAYLRGEGKYADRQKYFVPTMVLLDLRLPYVPGLEVLKEIRADNRLCRLIVVVLTSDYS